MKKLLTLTAIGTVLLATNATASGFFLREQSVSAMGNAFAGATAGADDISYSFYNPAALSKHDGTNISANATAILGNGKLKNVESSLGTNSVMDHNVDKAVLPAFYMSHQLNQKWTTGLYMGMPLGLVTDYSDNWAGAPHGTLSDLKTINFNPMVSYKATDKLSLGAGVAIEHISATLDAGIGGGNYYGGQASIEGDTTDIGYNLGALYQITDQTRIGAAYRSKIEHKLKGDVSFTGTSSSFPLKDQDVTARLNTPEILTFGIHHDINCKLSVMAEAQKTYWSNFDKLAIIGDNHFSSTTHENWKDVWFYSVGTSYQYNDQLKLRFGLAYDQNPTNEQFRTPRIPDSDRIWFSTGATYDYNENVTFNFGYTYIKGDDVKINLAAEGTSPNLKADAQADIHLVGLSANYNF